MIPKKILIGNIPYEIKVIDGLFQEPGDEHPLWGQIKYLDQEISVSNKLKDEAFQKILLHEITHGILQEYGMSSYNEEDFVDRLSSALYDFLTRNDLSFLTKRGGFVSDNLLKLFTTEPAAAKETINTLAAKTAKSPLEIAADIANQQSIKSRPRKLPVINPGQSSFRVSELATIKKQEEPEYWKTGIKIIDDEKHYKTRYVCPECGNKGTRYLPEDYQYVICHDCDEEIQKIPATEEGFPHRDSWGNYFIAGEVQQYGSEKS
jgi:hypothetical protein